MRFPFLITVFCSIQAVASAFQNLQTQQIQTATLSATRRDWLSGVATVSGMIAVASVKPKEAQAIGPVRIDLLNPKYSAVPCPKDKPIPGEKAMKGMRPMCVSVEVSLDSIPEKDLEKVGVYGFVRPIAWLYPL